jgi:hypothetical protein
MITSEVGAVSGQKIAKRKYSGKGELWQQLPNRSLAEGRSE